MTQRKLSLSLPTGLGGELNNLPVIVVEARDAGPTVAITANVHGDEVVGVEAIHMLSRELTSSLLKGAVRLYPTLNPEGLARANRRVPPEGQDLNRLFPGDALGTPAERLARVAWDDLSRSNLDLLVDLHSDSPRSIPYTILDRAIALRGERRHLLERRAELLAQAAGFTTLWEYKDKQYSKYSLDRSLTGAMVNRNNVPAFTIEAGPRLYSPIETVTMVHEAVMRVLRALKMVEAPGLSDHHDSALDDGPWRRAPGPRASVAGLLVPLAEPGASLKKGEVMAEVRGVRGERLEELMVSQACRIIALPERSWISPGVSSGTIAVRERR